MHADEVDIGVPLVRRLLTAEFRQWADLSLERVDSTGTSNALYRLGDDMVVRLPRVEWASVEVQKEQEWLPALLRIYHSPFLSRSVWARQRRDIRGPGRSTGGSRARTRPSSGLPMKVRQRRRWPPSCWRCSGSIPRADHRPARTTTAAAHRSASRDEQTRDAIATLAGVLDTDLINAAWEEALGASTWTAPPVWIHGDLLPGNLLVKDGRLCAVIDFGGLGVGDPACDLLGAWSLLSAVSRDVFRAALSVDGLTWARGRGWALSVALIALPYYQSTNPVFAALATRIIEEVLADHRERMT